MQSFKSIILFGGSFDPIHNGHINMVNVAIKNVNPDIVFVIPNFLNPQKKQNYSNTIDRLKMIELAFKNNSKVEISDVELNKKTPSYTIDTVEYFLNKYNPEKIYLLIGSDQLENFTSWYQYEKILSKVILLVYPRTNNINVNTIKYKLLKGPVLDISSTNIRNNVKPNDLPNDVLNYINDNGVYAIERISNYESQKRFNHSLRVANMCESIMKHYNPNLSKLAFTAGVYHDIAKEMEPQTQIDIATNKLNINNIKTYKLLHGYVGAYILKTNFLFSNELILNAIARHTRPFDYYDNPPTLLDKILYISDKIEPNRTNDDVFGVDIEYFRKLVYINIDKCFNELYELLQFHLNR